MLRRGRTTELNPMEKATFVAFLRATIAGEPGLAERAERLLHVLDPEPQPIMVEVALIGTEGVMEATRRVVDATKPVEFGPEARGTIVGFLLAGRTIPLDRGPTVVRPDETFRLTAPLGLAE